MGWRLPTSIVYLLPLKTVGIVHVTRMFVLQLQRSCHTGNNCIDYSPQRRLLPPCHSGVVCYVVVLWCCVTCGVTCCVITCVMPFDVPCTKHTVTAAYGDIYATLTCVNYQVN